MHVLIDTLKIETLVSPRQTPTEDMTMRAYVE